MIFGDEIPVPDDVVVTLPKILDVNEDIIPPLEPVYDSDLEHFVTFDNEFNEFTFTPSAITMEDIENYPNFKILIPLVDHRGLGQDFYLKVEMGSVIIPTQEEEEEEVEPVPPPPPPPFIVVPEPEPPTPEPEPIPEPPVPEYEYKKLLASVLEITTLGQAKI